MRGPWATANCMEYGCEEKFAATSIFKKISKSFRCGSFHWKRRCVNQYTANGVEHFARVCFRWNRVTANRYCARPYCLCFNCRSGPWYRTLSLFVRAFPATRKKKYMRQCIKLFVINDYSPGSIFVRSHGRWMIDRCGWNADDQKTYGGLHLYWP